MGGSEDGDRGHISAWILHPFNPSVLVFKYLLLSPLTASAMEPFPIAFQLNTSWSCTQESGHHSLACEEHSTFQPLGLRFSSSPPDSTAGPLARLTGMKGKLKLNSGAALNSKLALVLATLLFFLSAIFPPEFTRNHYRKDAAAHAQLPKRVFFSGSHGCAQISKASAQLLLPAKQRHTLYVDLREPRAPLGGTALLRSLQHKTKNSLPPPTGRSLTHTHYTLYM